MDVCIAMKEEIIKEEIIDARYTTDKTITIEDPDSDTTVKYTDNIPNINTDNIKTEDNAIVSSVFEVYQETYTSTSSSDINNVTEKKLYKCASCKYSTVTKGNLVQHMRTHTGIKP